MPDDKEPYLKFYPSDWLGDTELRGCTLAAQGLWINMLALMHKGVPYGHLARAQGVPMEEAYLARQSGSALADIKRLLRELETEGVFSRTAERVIFSRRMVRDKHRRILLKQNASAGGIAKAKADAQARRIANSIANSENSEWQNPGTGTGIGTGSGSEEKTAPGDDNAAEIPTVAEIVAFGAGPAGIPEAYCVYYHAVCDEKQRWTVCGRLLLWRKEIVRWWAEARGTWRQKNAPAAGKADLEAIEAELQWQKDPVRVAELLKKRRELEGGK